MCHPSGDVQTLDLDTVPPTMSVHDIIEIVAHELDLPMPDPEGVLDRDESVVSKVRDRDDEQDTWYGGTGMEDAPGITLWWTPANRQLDPHEQYSAIAVFYLGCEMGRLHAKPCPCADGEVEDIESSFEYSSPTLNGIRYSSTRHSDQSVIDTQNPLFHFLEIRNLINDIREEAELADDLYREHWPAAESDNPASEAAQAVAEAHQDDTPEEETQG